MSTSLLFIATTLSFANAHADLIANWVSLTLSTDFQTSKLCRFLSD